LAWFHTDWFCVLFCFVIDVFLRSSIGFSAYLDSETETCSALHMKPCATHKALMGVSFFLAGAIETKKITNIIDSLKTMIWIMFL